MNLKLTTDQATILGMVLIQAITQTDTALDNLQVDNKTDTNEWNAHQLWLAALRDLQQTHIDAEEEESDEPIVMKHYKDEEGIMDHSYSTLELADMDLNIIQAALQFGMKHASGSTEEWKQLSDSLEPIRKSHPGAGELDELPELSLFPDQFTYEELELMENTIEDKNSTPYTEAQKQLLLKIETQKNYLRNLRYL